MISDYFHVQLRQGVILAVPLHSVAEVFALNLGQICPIPGVVAVLLGVTNQRGRLLWVLELADLLGLPATGEGRRPQDRITLLVLSAGETDTATGQAQIQLGCGVTALKGIVTLDSSLAQPVTDTTPGLPTHLLSGVLEVNQQPTALLNVEAVLAAIHSFTVPAAAIGAGSSPLPL
uniref:CheW protein n=1 Tax=Cyanothece sp. (strain PCC 7425 / ATCC 29141) TaxID=395961 RepID=B8HM42_CYAP4